MSITSKLNLIKSVKRHFEISYFVIFREYLSDRDKPIKATWKNTGVSFFLSLNRLVSLSKLLDNNWKIIDSTNTYIKVKGPKDEILYCRTQVGNDLGHIVEIFLDRDYRVDLQGENVIDVGMSNGDSSIFFAKNGAKRVIGLEPDRRSFYIALNSISESKVNDIVLPLNKALSDQSGIVELIVSDAFPNANSLDEKNVLNAAGRKFNESVEAVTLKEIIDKFNGEDIDLLKMDCEGCEYTVLRGISHEYFSKISNLILEYHNGLQEIPELLNRHGFHVDIKKSNKIMGYIKASRKPL